MPLPRITDAIKNASKRFETGWTLLTLVNPPRANAPKPGKTGVNYFFEFEGQTGPGNTEENKGRRDSLMISGGALASGIADVCETYYSMLSALTGLSGAEILDKDIPDEAIVGKSMWADIEFDVNEGKKFLRFKQISPATEIPF